MAISELTEITNETTHTYYMYVWDNKNEGRYQPYGKPDAQWEYPDDGKWLKLAPGAHLLSKPFTPAVKATRSSPRRSLRRGMRRHFLRRCVT